MRELASVLEQIAKDADLLGVNVIRQLKALYPDTAAATDPTRKWNWNPLNIPWTQKTGDKGPFEMTDDVNNQDFKALHKDLTEHKGALNRDNCFYWTFPNGTTIGRKVVKK